MWYATDTMTGGQFPELRRLYGFSLDHRAFHCELMGEHHGSRAMGSSRGNEDL
jgi:hypothetical protein